MCVATCVAVALLSAVAGCDRARGVVARGGGAGANGDAGGHGGEGGDAGDAGAQGGEGGGTDGGRRRRRKPTRKKRKLAGEGRPLRRAEPVAGDDAGRGEGECGSVEIDGVEVPLACGVDLDADGSLGSEGLDVVPRAAIDGDATRAGGLVLPDVIDHRDDGTEGPVRAQGKVGSCTAHALAAAIDHAVLRRGDETAGVSVLHIWSRYHVPKPTQAERGNAGRPLTSEAELPYDAKMACRWVSKKGCKGCVIDGEAVPCGQPVDAAIVARAEAAPHVEVLHTTRVDAPTPLVVRQIVARGQDVWVGMKIDRRAFKAAKRGDHVVGEFDAARAKGGHSMVIAGYRVQADGVYFLLHNSWGARWGDGGYGWLHERQLAGVKAVRVVEAVRHGEALPAGAMRPSKAATRCAEGQVPDAATQVCGARCGDGSPPLGGACPEQGCDAGEVRVGDRCVASAPTRRGVVKPSGVAFACAPGGCVYEWPTGRDACEGGGCSFACAAPAFLLARSADGYFCTE